MSTLKHQTLSTFTTTTGATGQFYSLPKLAELGFPNLNRLPVSIRIVLESVLRNCDGKKVTEDHIRDLANWQAQSKRTSEIPFIVARVVLQDFTGVPLLADLAAMRNVARDMGQDPKKIEPLVPVDLVVDHSVMIDHYGTPEALVQNMEIEFQRNGGPGTTTGVFLRGSESRFTAVYIDGVRIDSQSTGGAPWESIPLGLIDRIEVLRGPAGAVYGSDAMGGVVQIFTKRGESGTAPYVGVGLGSHGTSKLEAGISGASGTLAALGEQAMPIAEALAQELDLGLPDRDGLTVIGEIRAWSAMPILVISARGQERDKIAALDAGADDYIAKPASAADITRSLRRLLAME